MHKFFEKPKKSKLLVGLLKTHFVRIQDFWQKLGKINRKKFAGVHVINISFQNIRPGNLVKIYEFCQKFLETKLKKNLWWFKICFGKKNDLGKGIVEKLLRIHNFWEKVLKFHSLKNWENFLKDPREIYDILNNPGPLVGDPELQKNPGL